MIVIKIPINLHPASKDCDQAPDKIVQELKKIYSTEQGKIIQFSEDTITTADRITDKAKQLFKLPTNSIFIGGDHAITVQLMKAFAETHKHAGIVILDAHADCSNQFSTPTQQDLLLELIKFIPPEHIVLVGTRRFYKDELSFLNKNKIKFYSMLDISREGKEELCDAMMSTAKDFGAFYLSIDMDIADPACAPGVNDPVPGGFTSRELLYFVQRLRCLKNFRAADICEVNPEKDVNWLTVSLAAKVASELI